MTGATLLVELLTEELPPKALPPRVISAGLPPRAAWR